MDQVVGTPDFLRIVTALTASTDVRKVSYSDITITKASDESPIVVNQCCTKGGVGKAHCNTSTCDTSGASWRNIRGSANMQYVARMQCSRGWGGCDGFSMQGFEFVNSANNSAPATKTSCSYVNKPKGFKCSY
jgi:hypothetical protein